MNARHRGRAATMVLASFIAAYAVLVLVVPGFGPLFIGELRAVANWAVVARMSS